MVSSLSRRAASLKNSARKLSIGPVRPVALFLARVLCDNRKHIDLLTTVTWQPHWFSSSMWSISHVALFMLFIAESLRRSFSTRAHGVKAFVLLFLIKLLILAKCRPVQEMTFCSIVVGSNPYQTCVKFLGDRATYLLWQQISCFQILIKDEVPALTLLVFANNFSIDSIEVNRTLRRH